MVDVGAAIRIHHKSEGWKLAMDTASQLIEMMIKWDHSSLGVYETYELAFEIAMNAPLKTSADELYQLWIIEREKEGL